VAENSRPPVAIRIVRPYDTEDELLEHELETVGKTSVVLIGAHPRPTGVILRFEVTLSSGATVLRGEGRVLAHKENAFRGQPGLTLRFTRLDPRSKAVVDRATAMRDARAQGEVPVASPSRPAPRPDLAIAEALTASTPAPSMTAESASASVNPNADQEAAVASARASAREKANATARANAKRTGSMKPMGLTPPPVPVVREQEPDASSHDDPTPAPTPVTSIPGVVAEKPVRDAARSAPPPVVRSAPPPSVQSAPPPPVQSAPPPPVQSAPPPPVQTAPPAAAAPNARPAIASTTRASGASRAPIEPPPDRADLLARLRERAERLPPERVTEILSPRR
jgi:hypothetical protein